MNLLAEIEWTNQHTVIAVIGSSLVAIITALATKGVDGYLKFRSGTVNIRKDELALEIQNDERLPPGIKAMVKILDDGLKNLQIDFKGLRLEHEKCLQDHATAVAEREAIRRDLDTIIQKHENLKRRVGGSDVLPPGVVSELMPPDTP